MCQDVPVRRNKVPVLAKLLKITLQLIGALDQLVDVKEYSFPEDKIELFKFIEWLANRYGPMVAEHLLPEGAFNANYAILVNGANIKRLNDMKTELKDRDNIVVFTMMEGG